MARRTAKAQAKARHTLINTLCKISGLDPVLGGRWQRGMLRYYSERLAELTLKDVNGIEPTPWQVEAMAMGILEALDSGDLDGQ